MIFLQLSLHYLEESRWAGDRVQLHHKQHLAQEGLHEDPLTQRHLIPRSANFACHLACPQNLLLCHSLRCWLRCGGHQRVADTQAQPRQELLHRIVAGQHADRNANCSFVLHCVHPRTQGGKVVCWKTLGLHHLLEEQVQVPAALEHSANFLEESQHSHLLFARGAHKVDVVADVVLIAGRSERSN